MKDAEYIYSLYVQANPVPDADLLPLTRDEAALLTSERSQDMITEERPTPEPAPPKRRRAAVALSAAAVLIVAVGVVAILASGGADPVAAGDANPVVEFNGTACSYEGPTLIEEGMVEFSLSNAGDEGVAFALLRVDEAALSEELSDAPVGGDWAITDQTPAVTFGNMRFALVSPNESRLQEWAMASGIYLMDCATGEPGATEHVWRVAQVEVVAP